MGLRALSLMSSHLRTFGLLTAVARFSAIFHIATSLLLATFYGIVFCPFDGGHRPTSKLLSSPLQSPGRHGSCPGIHYPRIRIIRPT